MAVCNSCNSQIPDGSTICPHCHATQVTYMVGESEVLSPFQARASAARTGKRRPSTSSRSIRGLLPAGLLKDRRALFGGLGVVMVVGIVAVVLAVTKGRSSPAYVSPTPSPPPTRPDYMPSPVPTPPAEWRTFLGVGGSYAIDMPPYWVVIDFADSDWAPTFRRQSLRFSWLEDRFPEEIRQQEAQAQSLWAFDPRRVGLFFIRCWLDPNLAGLAATDIQTSRMETLLEIPTKLGGRAQGGVRAELVEVNQAPAARFEIVVLPYADSAFDRPLKYQSYALADEGMGYWIEVGGMDAELKEDADLVEKVISSFHTAGPLGQRDE